MNDGREHVGIPAARYRREKVPSHKGAALHEIRCCEVLLRAIDSRRQVKEDAGDRRMSLQQGNQEFSLSSTHIYDLLQTREVIRRHDCRRSLACQTRHSLIKDAAGFGVLRKILKEPHTKDMVECGLARLHAIRKVTASTGQLLAENDGRRSQRARHVTLQVAA